MSKELGRRATGGRADERVTTGQHRFPVPTLAEEVSARKKIAPTSLTTPKQLSPGDFNSAMIHFYRGEVQRSNTWRNRLDTTTNWAVLTAGATLSFVFSSASNPHFVIPINSILVAIFLVMEARRYRYYEIWSSRVRVLETGYFAPILSPDAKLTDREWAEHLAADLLVPHFTISEWEAIGRRLRRNYIWIFALLALSWNLKVYLHPYPALNFDDFLSRAKVGLVPGWAVFVCGIIFNTGVMVFAAATVRLRDATGEVLSQNDFALHPLRKMTDWTKTTAMRRKPPTSRAQKARQRVRTTATDAKKVDTTETPDRDPHVSETPDRRPSRTETVYR
jgi:uncharacterized membrane protein